MKKITLANGYELPCICLGTDIVEFTPSLRDRIEKNIRNIRGICKKGNIERNKKNKGIITCFKNAMKYGCNFYDTSRAYGDAESMLNSILQNVKREDYYICTKLDNKSQLSGVSAREVLMTSMKKLGVDYVDVFLIHWPVEGKYLGYWKQLEELYKEGLVKAIGVSNCKIHHLDEIIQNSEIVPMINEVELHPLLSECELRKYCNDKNIQVMAYTSTARMDFRLRSSRRLQSVCKETGKNLSQVILRWHIQNGVIPIFNTSSLNHLKENMDIFDFELTDNQMMTIDSVNINARTRYDSDNCEWDRL